MHFPDAMKRASVTGTAKGHELLRKVAIYSLQQTAGYLPRTLPESAYLRQVHDARPVTLSRTTSQLYRMILGDFQFEKCFPELCLLIAQHGMRVPSELIPALLDSHLIYSQWRDVALLAMGSYARWVVAHQHQRKQWQWVKQTPTPTVDSIYDDIENKSRAWVGAHEKVQQGATFRRSLATFQYFWSDALAERVIHHVHFLLRYVPSDQWRRSLRDIHTSFAYYAPLTYHDIYNSYLKEMRERQITDLDISAITAYRYKLKQIIIDDATQLSIVESTG